MTISHPEQPYAKMAFVPRLVVNLRQQHTLITTCLLTKTLLDHDFAAEHPGEKMVSDITYIPTDKGWLYLSGVMDLCGRKMIGVAMGIRMTKQLVMDALQDINHTNNVEGCILHSDRGSQYLLPRLTSKWCPKTILSAA